MTFVLGGTQPPLNRPVLPASRSTRRFSAEYSLSSRLGFSAAAAPLAQPLPCLGQSAARTAGKTASGQPEGFIGAAGVVRRQDLSIKRRLTDNIGAQLGQ
jgi:hypothetical protein